MEASWLYEGTVMSKNFLRRSLLYIPGSSVKMLKKVAVVDADAVILDLEDSVSPAEKYQARENVSRILQEGKCDGKEYMVRINGIDTLWGIHDLLSIMPCRPDAIILPKADEKSILAADTIMSALEAHHSMERDSIKLIPLLETAYAIINAYHVLGSAVRIDGVQLGGEDLAKELEIARTSTGEELMFARQNLVLAGKARKIDVLDTPFTHINDLDGLKKDASIAKSIGFSGKVCVHPVHIDLINEIFSPSVAEVNKAKALVEEYEASIREGRGACSYGGEMVDTPVAERAKRILEDAERIHRCGRNGA